MTKKELSQLYYLNREIERDKLRLLELENAASSATQRITGMPFVGGISDKVGNYATEIAELKELIGLKIRQCWLELNKINRYISGIDDSLLRSILSLRYVNGFSWDQVAAHIGGGNTEKSVQMMVRRFLDQN